jgi:hypothetical protein
MLTSVIKGVNSIRHLFTFKYGLKYRYQSIFIVIFYAIQNYYCGSAGSDAIWTGGSTHLTGESQP